jgi:hypothetical protein
MSPKYPTPAVQMLIFEPLNWLQLTHCSRSRNSLFWRAFDWPILSLNTFESLLRDQQAASDVRSCARLMRLAFHVRELILQRPWSSERTGISYTEEPT